ncbi:hypothetical protein RS130_19640 [Paraglaciecola aquimarina]|uniref:Orphan protein n=1 Tax=Paraglaciecola aquimarina TaxID=1235557 RepID=A0ABU3T0L2_9ALTE|nr:hypothetical protein [Paraglaciecola aquimarina]MDU0355804.1 hypothetical protein [Paraglaciecola aquimarina]
MTDTDKNAKPHSQSMPYYTQACHILEQTPLPDDAPVQFATLAKQATGMERRFIDCAAEGLHAAATTRQIEMWAGKDK